MIALTANGVLNVVANSATLITPPSGVAVGWNLSAGTGETDFVNSAGGLGGGFRWYNLPANYTVNSTTGTAMSLDPSGNLHVLGTITGSGKTFNIPHPLDKDKRLVHGCLEGPEFGVYYRGEAETEDGLATIDLPDYFEALTRPDSRTIQLTELYEDETDPIFGNFLAAGRIRNGRFSVRSSAPSVRFCWEVRAVRGDIEPL